jgi:putative ABC transport system substrate-binding protein
MRRRDFIAFVSSAAIALPLAVRAQQTGRPPVIGFVGENASAFPMRTKAFVQRLHELGWDDGRSVAIYYRWSEGSAERVAEIATELVQKKVDVFVTYGSVAVALKKATSSIPIVFAIAADPLSSGLVASLSQPGGNATGLSLQLPEIAGKRLELLRQVLPGLRRVGIIFDAGYPAAVSEASNAEETARKLGLEVAPLGCRSAEDISRALDALKGNVDAIYVVENHLLAANAATVVALALRLQLPTTFASGDFVKRGALMSYGANLPALYGRAAEYVDKILRGAKPAELPVQQPINFDLTVNLTTAMALGLTVPDKILAIADEVIE